MCWHSKKLDFKFASEDISVYKIGYTKTIIMEDGAKQVFRPYWRCAWYYCKNEVNKHEDCFLGFSYDEHKNCYTADANWFHSYSMEKTHYKISESIDKVITIYNGNYKEIKNYPSGTEIGRFIIPKGTRYAINEDGEIISKKLMFVGKIEKK